MYYRLSSNNHTIHIGETIPGYKKPRLLVKTGPASYRSVAIFDSPESAEYFAKVLGHILGSDPERMYDTQPTTEDKQNGT